MNLILNMMDELRRINCLIKFLIWKIDTLREHSCWDRRECPEQSVEGMSYSSWSFPKYIKDISKTLVIINPTYANQKSKGSLASSSASAAPFFAALAPALAFNITQWLSVLLM